MFKGTDWPKNTNSNFMASGSTKIDIFVYNGNQLIFRDVHPIFTKLLYISHKQTEEQSNLNCLHKR